MSERLIGIETEYAISGNLHRQDLLLDLMQEAKKRFAHLHDCGEGLFLGNGSRLYVDYGMHPEMATPECTTPWEVVRYILAGEQILLELIEQLETSSLFGDRVNLYKCNVDYAGEWTTWGCHESYLHRMNQMDLSRQIIPHLVSRIIYTGAGGFISNSPGLEFTLSPRVPHLSQVMSGDSTSNRGIFHTKDEALAAGGYHRLHLICGESLSSETGMWLKVAMTALVVALAESGLRIGHPVELIEPLKAMDAFASDPECKATAETASGKRMTALQIQRHYLARAEAHMHDSFMPAWAEEACRKWRAILDRLEGGAENVKTTLDWGIKYALYRDFAHRQGLDWDALSRWTQIFKKVLAELSGTEYGYGGVSIEIFMDGSGPATREVQLLLSFMEAQGLRIDELDKFLRLRKQLFEIDMRFGQLTRGGIFTELAKSGVLDTDVPGIGDVKRAKTYPPETSRARVRGNFIRRVASDSSYNYTCDWQSIRDNARQLIMDLTDPFAKEEKWLKWDEFEQPPLYVSQDYCAEWR